MDSQKSEVSVSGLSIIIEVTDGLVVRAGISVT